MTNLVSGKLALRYSGPALEAMKAVALSAKARSLADFQVAFSYDEIIVVEILVLPTYLLVPDVTISFVLVFRNSGFGQNPAFRKFQIRPYSISRVCNDSDVRHDVLGD